ncbi:DUF2306 domain-containing protein [Flavobacterium sp. W21_SRS_FM6]|uniref:DUF2306 domain-containing protein n=1 Tax=Flavobacterium sp. W21_SRS_FM6 TaxID=3240268 RepID=UPI003F8FE614
MIEIFHIILGFSSLLSGLFIVLTQKGNKKHKLVGRVYFLSMLGLNLTSFGIYKLFDGWGFFHWMAVASLIPIVAGYIAIRYKNITAHYYFMCWSYIGLLCATISEIFVHVPVATALLDNVAHIDTLLMVCLIGFGFYFLPRKQSVYVRKT